MTRRSEEREDLERRIDNLERFQSWLMGAFAAVSVFGTGFALLLLDKIKKVLGLG